MRILDPLSGREVDLRPSGDANAFTPSVRVPQDEVRSHLSSKLDPGGPDPEMPRARTSTLLPGLQKRFVVLSVVLGALCISGWSAFGYSSWSSAAAERERLAQITASEAAREDLGGELKR